MTDCIEFLIGAFVLTWVATEVTSRLFQPRLVLALFLHSQPDEKDNKWIVLANVEFYGGFIFWGIEGLLLLLFNVYNCRRWAQLKVSRYYATGSAFLY